MVLTNEMLVAAQVVVKQEVRRAARFATCSDNAKDFEAEALLQLCEAARTFDPTKGEWTAHARMYVRTYVTRASNKAKSVVTTNHTSRRIERDGSMLVQSNEDGWVEIGFADEKDNHAQHEARMDLSKLYDRFVAAAKTLPSQNQKLARALIDIQFELTDETDISVLADKHGCSRPHVYNVKKALALAAGVAR